MDLSKLRELALKKEQYNDVKKEIENAEKEYKSYVYKLRDEVGNKLVDSLQRENKIFSNFRVKDIYFSLEYNCFSLTLQPIKGHYGEGYMTFTYKNMNLHIPILVEKSYEERCGVGDRYKLFFQDSSHARTSINITEMQKAWDIVCAMNLVDLNTIFKETK